LLSQLLYYDAIITESSHKKHQLLKKAIELLEFYSKNTDVFSVKKKKKKNLVEDTEPNCESEYEKDIQLKKKVNL